METRTKILLCVAILLSTLAYSYLLPLATPPEWQDYLSEPFSVSRDPFAQVRDRMVTVGGSKHFERQVDLSETEYEEMDTSWYDYEVRAKPEFLTFSSDSSIKKLTVGDYYRLRIGYTVSASEHAGVGDYTFHVVYTIGDYKTELAAGVYVVEEIPAPPTETPWFIWPMIFAPGLLFLFAIGYLLYLLIGSATHRFRRY